MQSSPTGFERPGLPLLWMLATSLGWALVPFTPLQTTFRTYAEIVRQVPAYAVFGLLLGAATGLGQALVWKLQGRPAARWWWASAVGFGLALPAGLLVVTLTASSAFALAGANFFFLPLTEPAGMLFVALPPALALCGGIVGLAQWPFVRRLLPRARTSMALLWVFGVWLSLSLGMYLGALARELAKGFAQTTAYQGLIGRSAAGAIIGMLTGALLIVLMRESQRSTKRPLAPLT